MTSSEIIDQIKALADAGIKKIYSNHGAPSNQYGVRIQDLKKIQKKIKKDHALSLELYDSGIPDAQYLAGLIADETRITEKELQHWAENATWYMISEYTVAWVAAESNHGWKLAYKWIDSKKESVQSSGWATLASLALIKDDKDLDIKQLKALLQRVEGEIHSASNRVRYTMNSFVISVGSCIKELTGEALTVAERTGKVYVNMGNTACKVPYAPAYIKKMIEKKLIGKKKKMARCV